VIGDVVRVRGRPDEVERVILNTAVADGRACQVSLPQDPGQAGKFQVRYLVGKLAGYRVHTSPESGDKVTRAEPFAAQVNVGNVDVVINPAWNDLLKAEMRMFPNAAHDDIVDAGSRAFSVIGGRGAPMRVSRAAVSQVRSHRPMAMAGRRY
jgi:predicted phage terminase large subunit-like protein